MSKMQSAVSAKPVSKKMPVAGKSGKDGVTANIRVKDQPVTPVNGQFQPH
jgi:hypothetical protein